MEAFSALQAICAGNAPVTDEFPAQRPVKRSFDVFFNLRLNKRLSRQSWGWWLETPSRPLWRHCNVFLGLHGKDNRDNQWGMSPWRPAQTNPDLPRISTTCAIAVSQMIINMVLYSCMQYIIIDVNFDAHVKYQIWWLWLHTIMHQLAIWLSGSAQQL